MHYKKKEKKTVTMRNGILMLKEKQKINKSFASAQHP